MSKTKKPAKAPETPYAFRIKGKAKGEVAEEGKRFYMPGVTITGKCRCSANLKMDLGESYLAYPPMNAPDTLTFWCDVCNEETEIRVQLNVSLEVL